MPRPNPGETEKEYLKRCIPDLIHEGYGQKQAIAICYNMYGKYQNKDGKLFINNKSTETFNKKK